MYAALHKYTGIALKNIVALEVESNKVHLYITECFHAIKDSS